MSKQNKKAGHNQKMFIRMIKCAGKVLKETQYLKWISHQNSRFKKICHM